MFPIQVRVCGTVDCCFAIDDSAEGWGEFFVCAITAGPKSVAADCWDSVVVEMSDSCWLFFVDEICVPARISAWLAKAGSVFGGLEGWPNHGYAQNTGDLRYLGLWYISWGF